MKKLPEIEVCAVGTWPGSGGKVKVTDKILQELADSYDPKLHQAPAVLGHPKTDAPALGWFAGFKKVGDKLIGVPRKLKDKLVKAIKAESYKYVSLSFYHPNTPGNPKPGSYYVKHVGWLGAMPPAVKGMKEYALAEGGAEPTEIYLAADEAELAWSIKTTRSIFSKLRDFLIDKYDKETADEIIPEWRLDSLIENAQRIENTPSKFSEDDMTDDIETIKAEAARLHAELEQMRNAAALSEAAAKIEAIADERNIPEAVKEAAITVLEAATGTAELSEGQTMAGLIEGLLKTIPVIELGEKAKKKTVKRKPLDIKLPAGYELSEAEAERLQKAQELAEAEGIDLGAALYKIESED